MDPDQQLGLEVDHLRLRIKWLYETITAKDDVMVKEVSDVLYEWNIIWKELYVTNRQLFEKIRTNMLELIQLRSLLVDKKITEEDVRDVKNDIVSVIDWGNGQLDMDLVPRIDGEQLDADLCSLTQMYRVHANSSKIALQDKPQRKRRKTGKSSKTELAMEAGLTTHHLLVSFCNFNFPVTDHTETLLSLHINKEPNITCISEKFLVKNMENSVKGSSKYGLFMDLSSDEIDKDIYLVAQIYRIGSMKPSEHVSRRGTRVNFKRPWGVAVINLNLGRLPATFKEWEFTMKVYCPNNEKDFSNLHKDIINGRTNSSSAVTNSSSKQHLSLTVSVQILHGDLATVKKEEPILFSKGVAQVQKYGFTEVISPGEVRNDLYVTLKTCDLERGNKKTGKNLEVRVTVLNDLGKTMENCISYGCGEEAASEYLSGIYYHNNRADWNETIRLSIPIDKFPGCHVCFEIYHCSVSRGNQKKVPYGFAFMKVTNDAQIVIKDDDHDLCVYHLDEKHQKDLTSYFHLPFRLEDLNDPRQMVKVNKQMFHNNERGEYLKVSTLLCSGKFTQNSDLLGILNWKGNISTIDQNLEKLCNMQGEEIVKFLHDIMDALFDMLMEESLMKHHSDKIFKAMIFTFTILHHTRFEMFKPVLENYISDTFSATLVHKPLCACFAQMIETSLQGGKTNNQLMQSFRNMDYIFRFIVQSRMLQRKDVYSRSSDDANEFRANLHKIFKNMGTLLSSDRDRHKGYQVELLSHLHLAYSPLMTVMSDSDVADMLRLCLEHMPDITKMPEDIIRVKLELLRRTVDTHLFISDASRNVLLPLCLHEVKQSLEEKKLMRISMELLSDIMDCIFKLKKTFQRNCLVDVGTISIKEDIQNIIQTLFDVVMETIINVDHMSRGSLISCLMEMLRLMDDEHYDSLLHVYHRGKLLRKFIVNILEVFYVLVQPHIFPTDWSVLRMITNNIIFTSVTNFSDAMRNNFMVADKFDLEVWTQYFKFAVCFITQPSLQLDRYTDVKARKFKESYQDMRVLMGVQMESLWHALGVHKCHFIPSMVGPFLELTLVPEVEVRKVTLPIIFDMMECNQKRHGNFKQVEAELMERLDFYLTHKHVGDMEYKDMFKCILLERVQSEPSLQENGPQFIISVTHLLERLLDYRQVVDGEENRDKRMHCTFNILNFYKDEINREEMYIRYVNKLHDLHMVANNHAEAGLTLQLYAKVLGWSDYILPEEMKYKQERERDRKEMLYNQIINCFDRGKVWEYALPLCKDLAAYYERNLDYKKLSDTLKQQALFYQKILEGVPDDPRQDPSYYAVAYYGKSFPAFVRNKQFIYRGDECLKLATIMNHLTAEFPTATIVPFNTQSDHLKEGDQQFIQVCSVKAVPAERPEFNGKDVPLEIRNFYRNNEVDTFLYDKPYHREHKDPNNEAKTLCCERYKMKTAYKFPGILRWYEVVEVEIETLCPIRVAIEPLQQNINDLQLLVARCQMNPKLFFPQLEMKLSGIISAHVGGGITRYHEAFFTEEFKNKHPDEVRYLDTMKSLLTEQVGVLSRGMSLHKQLVTADLQPLHDNLEKEFRSMKKTVQEYSSPHSSTFSLGNSRTPGSGSSRSSTYSQDEDGGLIQPEGLSINQSRTGSDPALPTGGLSHLRATTGSSSPQRNPVERTKTVYVPKEQPQLPRRKMSVPAIPTQTPNGLGTIHDSEVPQIPEKKSQRSKPSFNDASHSPNLQRQISSTSTTSINSSDVPPLPPRKSTSRSDIDRPSRLSVNRFSTTSHSSVNSMSPPTLSPPTPGPTTPGGTSVSTGPPIIPRRSDTRRAPPQASPRTHNDSIGDSTKF